MGNELGREGRGKPVGGRAYLGFSAADRAPPNQTPEVREICGACAAAAERASEYFFLPLSLSLLVFLLERREETTRSDG
jgi:hypothetical protein